MNLKKFFAGTLSLAMAISAVNFSYAEPTEDFVDVGGKFAENVSGFEKKDMGTVNFLGGISHTEDGTGSLKFEGRTWNGITGDRVAVGKSLAEQNLEIGETYLLKAYVYGERINADDYVRMGIYSDYNANDNKYTQFVSDNTPLTKNGWTEISQYFIATDKTSDFKLIFPSMTTTGGNDANTETYGIVYIDDVTIEKQTDADDYFNSLSDGPKSQYYSKTSALKWSFRKLDVTKTKSVLVENETVDLKAYLQNGVAGQTVGDLVRTAADKENITVTTSNRGVATYADGKITAHGCGTAVLDIKYNNGETTASSKLFVTVHPDKAGNFILGRGNANYATVTDPIDGNDTARIVLTKKELYSGVSASKPAVASFRIYNSGYGYIPNITTMLGTKNYLTFRDDQYIVGLGNQTSGEITRFNSKRSAGWEKIDIAVDYPVKNSYSDGYRLISFYLNGEMLYSYEDKINDLSGYFGIVAGANNAAVMIQDLAIVSMDSPYKVQSTNPAVGEKLSTLDDIDVNFNQLTTISDIDSCAALYEGDAEVETVKVLDSGNKKLSVIPQGGLKVNTEYTLKLTPDRFTNTIGETLTGTTEFTFVTTNDRVSDVVGSGYKLLSSQINVIENGSFKTNLGGDADKTDIHTLHLPSTYDKDVSISIPFDDSFKTNKISADRIILEFDTKVVSVLNNPDKEPPKDHQQEGWWISGQDALGNTSSLTKIGYNRTWGNPFGLWKGQFTLDANGKRQNGSTSGTYVVSTDVEKIASNIDNIGYVHVKIIYDLKQKDKTGDVLQTVTVNGGGIEFERKEVSSALFSGYPDVTTLSGFTLYARNLIGSYRENENDTVGIYASKDTYLKNLNVYALKKAPELMPDAEIKNITVIDDSAVPVESAEGLKGKKVYVSAKLKNNKLGDNTSYVLVAAAYDKATNKLIDVVIGTPGTVNNGEEVQGLEFEDELDLSTSTGEAEIRVFAWNSMEGAMPLTDVYKPF